MKLPQASPEEGPKKDCDHFSNWKGIKGGERHTAYIAGPTQKFWMHTSDKGSKPCLELMTKKALPCRYCAALKEPVRVGYVPVYREVDFAPKLVIVYEGEFGEIDKLKTHTRVTIGREHEKGAALWVRVCLNQEPRFRAAFAFREFAQDAGESCLRLWDIPELEAWLRFGRVSDTAVSPPPPPAPATVSDDVRTGGIDAATNRIFGRVPSTNGKH